MEAIQKCQNKLLRVLNGTHISDKISIKSMLSSMNMLSVNQIMLKSRTLLVFLQWRVLDFVSVIMYYKNYLIDLLLVKLSCS